MSMSNASANYGTKANYGIMGQEYKHFCGANISAENVKELKKEVFLHPSDSTAWCKLGVAYGSLGEYNNALRAFEKALSFDEHSIKGAMGKAITLLALERNEEALNIANGLLSKSTDNEVIALRNVILLSLPSQTKPLSKEDALAKLADAAFDVLKQNELLGIDETVCVEEEIFQKEEFSKRVFDYCQKRYRTSTDEEFNFEVLASTFYASICATIDYYQKKYSASTTSTIDFIMQNCNMDDLEREAEKRLGYASESDAASKLWHIIYSYRKCCYGIIRNLSEDEQPSVTIDAAENAYVIGMAYAMKQKSLHTTQNNETSPSEDEPAKPAKQAQKESFSLEEYFRSGIKKMIEKAATSPEFVCEYEKLSEDQKSKFFSNDVNEAAAIYVSLCWLIDGLKFFEPSQAVFWYFELYITIVARLIIGMTDDRIMLTLGTRYPELDIETQKRIISFSDLHRHDRKFDMSDPNSTARFRDRELISSKEKEIRESLSQESSANYERDDYGLVADNPILVASIPQEYTFIASLECDSGEIGDIKRLGCVSSSYNAMVDAFELKIVGGDSITIYLCGYGTRNIRKAPKGFHFKPITPLK